MWPLNLAICVTAALALLAVVSIYQRESFTNVADNILTQTANVAITQEDAMKNNMPCTLKTNNGTNFQFKVENVLLDWFSVPNQPNTCSLDLSGDDLNDDPSACSMKNQLLSDGLSGLVKKVYWNDFLANKRCEVTFEPNPSQTQMTAYMKKQKSYTQLTECKAAIKEAVALREQKAALEKALDVSLQKERAALRLIADREKEIAAINAKSAALAQTKIKVMNDTSALKIKLADIQSQIKSADDQIMQVNKLIAQAKTDYERKLLEHRSQQLQIQRQLQLDIASQHASDVRNMQARLASMDGQISQLKGVIAANASTIQKMTGDLQSENNRRESLSSQLKEKTKLITQLKNWVCVPGILTPLRKNANDDIECMSTNNKDCIYAATAAACQEMVRTPVVDVKPLTCGSMHMKVHGFTGYDRADSWCARGKNLVP